MKHRFAALPAAVLALAVLLSGCSGGASGTSDSGRETAAADPASAAPETQPETPSEGDTQPMTNEPQTDTVTEPVTETDSAAETDPAAETETAPDPVELKNPEIEERYFIYRIWNFTKNSLPAFKSTVDAAQAAGFNAIKIHMPWYLIEQTAGSYDWSGFDEMFDYVINEKGMKALCSVDLTRNYSDKFFPDEAYMKDSSGKLSVGGSGAARAQISFCCDYAVEAAVNAYAATVAHFDSLYGDGILLYLPAFNQYAETEYWAVGEYDYSDAAVDTFRAWLEEKYGTLSALNTALGTEYAGFDEVQAPALSAVDSLGILWYQFRHEMLKRTIDRLSDAQKAVCPDTKTAVQIGCVWDAAAIRRGTLGFADLCEKVDVLWVDDGPTMNHEWSMDYIRSVLPTSVQLAQEIDGPSQSGATPENYLRQGLECFERGATYISIANWGIDANFEKYKPVWREIADTWLGDSHPEVIPMTADTPVMEMSLYDVFRSGSTGFAQGTRTGLSENGSFVYVRLTDDLTDRPVTSPVLSYSYPGNFSTVQGDNCFTYMSYARKQFKPMTWNETNNYWQGSALFTIISPNGMMHPDSADAALVFTAPQDGTVTYSLTASVLSADSNGVQVAVLVNGTTVWPESGKYQKTQFSSPASATLTLTVRAGDEIAFLLNPAGDNSCDSTAVSIDIVYN